MPRTPDTNRVPQAALDLTHGIKEAKAAKNRGDYVAAWAAVDAYDLPPEVVTGLGLPSRRGAVRAVRHKPR